MNESKLLARLGAYIVDMFIVGFVLFLISKIITSAIKVPEMGEDVINSMPDAIRTLYDTLLAKNGSVTFNDLYLEAYTNNQMNQLLNWLQSAEASSYYTALTSAYLKISIISLIFAVIIYFAYFALLPYFWEKQTVGRLILKVKVVKLDNTKATLGNFVVRDLVGTLLLSVINCCCGLHLILNLIFVLSKNRTIGDMISGTHLVSTNEKEEVLEEDGTINYNANSLSRPQKVSDDDIEIVIDEKND